jgi:hypothetical protein
VYLLAVAWDRQKTRARCSGSARAVSASWSTRSRRMRSMLTPCRCRFHARKPLLTGPDPRAVFAEIRTCRLGCAARWRGDGPARPAAPGG